MSKDLPGSRHLSAKAKKMWNEGTTEDNLPHFKGVCYNLIHTYCFFVCSVSSCDGCKVAELRSWMAALKTLPQDLKNTPVIREIHTYPTNSELTAPEIVVDEISEPEAD